MSDFDPLKSCLASWPRESPPALPLQDHSCERLRGVLDEIWHKSVYLGVGDLAGLIQHVIRRQRVLEISAGSWSVPLGDHWPSVELWKQSALMVISERPHAVTLEAPESWSAAWLPGSEQVSPLAAALLETQRRSRQPVDSLQLDPAIKIELGLPYETYSCSGQQQAIHAAMLMRPSATMAVNLPTGSGKSLVAWAVAMLAEPGMLSVIVVPTVALALDQERQMNNQFGSLGGGLPDRLAWHGSLTAEDKSSIWQRMRDGTQRVLFASPEAVIGPLCRELFSAARVGRLKYFVIDEAHIVSEWGDGFRPEFQSMAGLRRELIECCLRPEDRLRTLLLSATLTEDCLQVLRDLFSEKEFEVISAVHLRPEPEYWFCHAASREQKQAWVLELVRVVPRPFLLYVTERNDATDWTRRLNSAGYQRLGCVHGGTSGEERLRIIDEWRAGRLDGVVATSAFGLGMDKGDVRAVIHACVPETIDRFYQEVGRGGRDGKACVSFVVYWDRDYEVAESLSVNCFISVDRGRERWGWMMDGARPTARPDVFKLDLKTLPPDKSRGSPTNRAWNLRTLLLLNRAKIIQFESERPPEVHGAESLAEDYFDSSFVRILENEHRELETWQRMVEPLRAESHQRDRRNFFGMADVLRDQREIAAALAAAYTLRRDGIHVSPVKVCGGCPRCRLAEDMPRECRPPNCEPGQFPELRIDPRLQSLIERGGNNLLLVSCDGDLRKLGRQIQRNVLPVLVKWGISEVALPEEWRSQRSCQELYRESPHRFLIHRSMTDFDQHGNQIAVPRVTVFFPDEDVPFDTRLFQMERPLHIIFCDSRVKDPRRPCELLFDRAHHINYPTVLESLQS